MIAECQLESIQRIHALRSALDSSLVSTDSPTDSERSRQLTIVFCSAESTHIQYSGPLIDEEQAHQNIRPSSRFTVSPTPSNALPSFANSMEHRKQALHVLIAKPPFEEKDQQKTKKMPNNSIVVPPPTSQFVVSASSPASSIDSGVASPGSCADEFLLFCNNSPFSQHYRHRNSLPNPLTSNTSWESQTLPKARGRVFNFTTATSNKSEQFSPLIEALSLLPGAYKRRNEQVDEINYSNGTVKSFELQNPPVRKCHNQLERSSTTSLLLHKFNSGISDKRKEGSSLDSLNDGSLPPRSATMPPLKSILKKKSTYVSSTPSIPTMTTSIFSTQKKGMFSRLVPFRSISEDHSLDEQSQRSPFSCKNISSVNKNDIPSPVDSSTSISSNETIEEETDNGIADCFYCTSDNKKLIENEVGQQLQLQQKPQKRVSFSEQVQARVYRSTSSILGQRKKNEKKARSRATRRCNSDETDTSTANSLDVTSDGFERSQFLGIYHSQGKQSSCNNGNIVCKNMAVSSGNNTSGACGGVSVLAQ
ncbi:hypothetical protein Mgra_00001195 [Meloidogyne graminicola]|uniref:Uncharacterized protein n=1 Tax=Meloidogyne graminicola TaxID=189291 RepID=A0A8S9ZZP3_9BILA|nr:hypothetical protein Mgra_00001195 [Meloidogyne graminicola]